MALWHPHDRLFAAATSNPERALQLLRLALPEENFRKLDASSLKIESGSFLGEDLREQRSDLLLSARYAKMPVLVYALLEHKSDVEPMVLVQMLGYLANIWKAQHAAYPGKPLSPILPILISHAVGGWTGPVSLGGLFGGGLAEHPELAPYVPDYRVVLEDLQLRDNAALRRAVPDPGLALTLATLRDARRADMAATLRTFMEELKEVANRRDARLLLQQLVAYLVSVPPNLPLSELRAILTEASTDPEELMATIAEQLRGEGRAEGLRDAVRKLVGTFGELTSRQQARIDHATKEELEGFLERVRSADSIDAVLGLDA